MTTSTQAGALAVEAGERPVSLRMFACCVVLAGLGNAAIAAFLIFRLPADHAPSLQALLIRAVFYVAGAVIAGAAGARFYWGQYSVPLTTDPPLSFPLFALANAAAWVWVPAVVLLSRQDSPATAAFSALGAVLLASGLRRVLPAADESRDRQTHGAEREKEELFAATLATAPRETYGYVIALCLYAAGYFLVNHFYLNAGVPLALGAFLFAWKRTPEPASPLSFEGRRGRAALRFVGIAAAAVLVTLLVMAMGIGHRNRMEAALAAGNGSGDDADQRKTGEVYAPGISGYHSIILWPVPEKPQIVAPVLADSSPLSARTSKPMVIKFDGPYWYFQPPGQGPGPRAYQAHGNPLSVHIEANNQRPLHMEAVQNLATPVRLARCREVRVTVENRDNLRGAIALGVDLTDSLSPGKPSVSLTAQVIRSSEPDQFAIKLAPVSEVLRFAVPNSAALRKFNQITVQYYPEPEHLQAGTKVAIDQFELIPR